MKKLLEGIGLLFKILDKKKTKKRLKELKEQKEARRVKTEKDLEHDLPSQSTPYDFETPTPTRTEAIARSTAKKEGLVRTQKGLEKMLNPVRDKAIADLRKRHPQSIGGTGPNPYGHGKGLGKKIDRLTGTTKKSVQENRQIKRENKQIARQRRQVNAPERREVRRPKSGLYKDTPKNKKPLGYRTYEDYW